MLQIYRGYVDDPRNTDNSWMESVVVNFHDDTGELVGKLELQAGQYFFNKKCSLKRNLSRFIGFKICWQNK